MADEPVPYAFRAPLSVCVDFKSPGCHLALAPTCALADELGVEVDWLPLLVPPLTLPRSPASDDDRGTRHRRARALYLERDLMRYAADRGLALGDVYRAPDASVAALGLLWVKARDSRAVRAYLDQVFERWGREILQLDDPAEIRAVFDELGTPSEDFEAYASGPGPAELAALQAGLRAAGVFGVPGYVVGGEVFLGRQHLPMIRWLLTGRSGPKPI